MRILLGILLIAVLIIVVAYAIKSREKFGPCSNCPASPERTIAINAFRYPYSGSQYRSQWKFAPGGVKPPNSTDVAETVAAGNKSGMNQLTVPDQEYLTN